MGLSNETIGGVSKASLEGLGNICPGNQIASLPQILDQMQTDLTSLDADDGAVMFGSIEFKAQPNAADTITFGSRVYGFTSGGDVQITIGSDLGETLDNAVVAINADDASPVEVIKGSGENILNAVAKVGASASTFAIAESTSAVRMAVSAAVSKGGAAARIKARYDIAYTITAQDVLALASGTATGQIVIACAPSTIAPSSWQFQVLDANGVIQATTNVTLSWEQVASNQYALMLADPATANLAAGDIISVIAIF